MWIVATLIKNGVRTTDEEGNEIYTESEIEVYAIQKSIQSREFSAASQIGLKPEFMIEVWELEYSYEDKVRIDGEIYSVYRTYRNGDKVELYLTKRSGCSE